MTLFLFHNFRAAIARAKSSPRATIHLEYSRIPYELYGEIWIEKGIVIGEPANKILVLNILSMNIIIIYCVNFNFPFIVMTASRMMDDSNCTIL